MNSDFLTDGRANFRFDALKETHSDAAEFVGWPDRGGNFQRGLFYFVPAKVRSGVDAFERLCRFSCIHIFISCVADSFTDTNILSGALLMKCKSCNQGLANIDQNRCRP